jgi:hypothetical protein
MAYLRHKNYLSCVHSHCTHIKLIVMLRNVTVLRGLKLSVCTENCGGRGYEIGYYKIKLEKISDVPEQPQFWSEIPN